MTVSRTHEITAHLFQRLFFDYLKPMGLDYYRRSFGSAIYKAENSSAKQPDCQFLPNRLPLARTKKWPMLIVETGFLESPSKLISDTRF